MLFLDTDKQVIIIIINKTELQTNYEKQFQKTEKEHVTLFIVLISSYPVSQQPNSQKIVGEKQKKKKSNHHSDRTVGTAYHKNTPKKKPKITSYIETEGKRLDQRERSRCQHRRRGEPSGGGRRVQGRRWRPFRARRRRRDRRRRRLQGGGDSGEG